MLSDAGFWVYYILYSSIFVALVTLVRLTQSR